MKILRSHRRHFSCPAKRGASYDTYPLHLERIAVMGDSTMRRSPSPSTLPQLKSALTTLAAEFTVAAPPEVYRSFPDFKHELTEML